MVVVGYADRIDPREHGMLSCFGLGMPVVLALNIVFLVFWLAVKQRYAVIPIIGFVICWGPVRRYFPVNIPRDAPDGAIKVISYNVFMFNPWDLKPDEMNPIVDYLVNSGADIICLQEAGYDIGGRSKIDSAFASVYQYCDTAQKKNKTGDVLCLYTKFPILKKWRVKYKSANNLSEAYVLNINGQKTLLVNNHFESSGLTINDRKDFREMVHGDMDKDSSRWTSRLVLGKLGISAAKRASQADAVHKLIDEYQAKGMSVIVCGDFNDSPISYTHRRVAEGLTDCYVASATGPGWSYHQSGIRVRIDNIMCSHDWDAYGAKIDRRITSSDHYPIVTWLARKR